MDSETPHSEQIEAIAIRWLVRRHSGTWSDADQAELDAWLEIATEHRIQYIRATAAWNRTSRLKALGAGVPEGVIPARGVWGDARFFRGLTPEPQLLPAAEPATPAAARFPPERLGRPHLRYLAIATLLGFAVAIYLLGSGLLTGDRYSTPIGSVDAVPLADGTTVTLNTDTRIRVVMSEAERRVELDRGEAFFDVAKDTSRPFIVYAGERRVMAVGTKFSVRRERDDIQVVVTEGRVNVAALAEQALLPASTSKPSAYLEAGAIARTSKTEVIVRHDAAAEAEKLLSWRRGYVSFENIALADAVAEFNRYTTRKILIEDPAIAAIRVSGNFRSHNSSAFLALLERGFPVVVEEEGEHLVLKAR